MVIQFLFGIIPLSLSFAIHRMGNLLNIQCPRCSQQDESHAHFILHYKLSEATLDFISGIINLKYTFYSPFKLSREAKAIINGGFISQFHDGVLSEILPNLLDVLSQLRDFIMMDMTNK